MEEVAIGTSKKKDARLKATLLVVGAYVATLGIAICIISFTIMSLADTHSCSAMGRAMVTLWIAIAVEFLASVAVVGVIAWKVIPSLAGRLATVVSHAVALTASYLFLAFGLLVAFNC
jgi:hypothetical protein